MKIKTLLELATLSSSIYYLAKENNLIEKFAGASGIDDHVSSNAENDDTIQTDFIDTVLFKTSQLKDELEEKVEEMVSTFYKKVNIAHLDEIKGLKDQLEKSEMAIALLEARLNKLESK